MGFNPIEAALRAGRRTVQRVWVEKGATGGRLARLRHLARSRAVPVEEVDSSRLRRMAGGSSRSAHQGVLASVSALPYADEEQLLDACLGPALLVVADGVEDPRNLGALIRTAAGAGAAGVFIPERRSSGLSPAAAKAAAGAAEQVPVVRAGNVASLVKRLKGHGFWAIGLDARAADSWDAVEYPDRTALVVGGESRGLRRLVGETCDQVVSIPLSAGIESLNLTVAAGVCLYEALRQRRARGR